MARSSPSSRNAVSRWWVVEYLESLRADRPVLLSFSLFSVLAVVLSVTAWDYWQSDAGFVANVVAEMHGVLMDLLIFGCLLLWLDQRADRRRRIRRYRDAIEDYLGWDSEEALHRIVGNVRRLNRDGETPETLKRAYLAGADLQGADLSDTTLDGADLSGANLTHATLANSYLGTADFSGANLQEANLRGAHFGEFVGRRGAGSAAPTILDGANLRGANLRGIRHATADTFANVVTLYKAQLDPDLEAAIQQKYPALLNLESSKGHE